MEEAQIKTASVQIKTLTVNSRKLTLTVFRQIHRKLIIDIDTMQLKGIPWGSVNYYWNDDWGKIHLLWQEENELKRCILTMQEVRTKQGWTEIIQLGNDLFSWKRRERSLSNEDMDRDEVYEADKRFALSKRGQWNKLINILSQKDHLFIAL